MYHFLSAPNSERNEKPASFESNALQTAAVVQEVRAALMSMGDSAPDKEKLLAKLFNLLEVDATENVVFLPLSAEPDESLKRLTRTPVQMSKSEFGLYNWNRRLEGTCTDVDSIDAVMRGDTLAKAIPGGIQLHGESI